MQNALISGESKSTADAVFDKLHEDIVTLTLLPGTKISEADVARQLGVSRQPARDAFRRLHNLDLLEIRPQRATVVRRFSLPEIENTRFVRAAIELEVVNRACQVWDRSRAEKLTANLTLQSDAVNTGDAAGFRSLDYVFHKLICDQAGLPMTFETINTCKGKVERLCKLSLSNPENATDVLEDHWLIADALSRRCAKDARAALRIHVGRLDAVIAEIYQTHTAYFQ
ncbi:MAG: GntR family transcriptional regulator [Planktomarina sp.]